MNPPSTKSIFSTGHSMSQCQQNSVICSVCNIVICNLENEAFAHAILEKRLKIVHSTY